MSLYEELKAEGIEDEDIRDSILEEDSELKARRYIWFYIRRRWCSF
jgi:hypothetical protein